MSVQSEASPTVATNFEKPLMWRLEGWTSSRSTLWDGDRAVARFRIEGWRGATAVLEFGNTTWAFRRTDFWGRREVVRGGASGRDQHGRLRDTGNGAASRDLTLSYDPGWWGRGRVTSSGGRDVELDWRLFKFWRSAWEWRRGADSMIRFERQGRPFKSGFVVEVEPEARALPELPALVGLGWWLLLDARRRSSS